MAASAAMQVAAQIKPAQAPVDAAAVQKIVADAMAKQQPAAPREIILKIDEQPAVKIEEHTHPLFEKVLRLVGAGLNVMLVGPTQCGKSTLAEQIARALNARYGMLNCTAGASESHLTGWLLPVGDGGRFEYVPSQFVTMMEEGNSLFLLDEFDALDPNFSLVLQSIFANGTMALPHRTAKPLLVKHATARAMAAANTFGTGADIQYAGRYGQDAAALERWYVVEMGYDAALEARIAGRAAAAATPWRPVNFKQSDVQSLADWHATLRENAKGLRRAVSTRMLQKGVTALRAGCSLAEVKQDLLAGWTRDERSRAQVAS
jgi:MoxR-like ATPase